MTASSSCIASSAASPPLAPGCENRMKTRMTTCLARHLRAAAIALLTGATITSPLDAQAASPGARWEAQARALLKELVEINTTHSVGNTVTAAEAMARHMRAAGFPNEDVVVVENAPRKGNLIVRYRGRNTGRQPI